MNLISFIYFRVFIRFVFFSPAKQRKFVSLLFCCAFSRQRPYIAIFPPFIFFSLFLAKNAQQKRKCGLLSWLSFYCLYLYQSIYPIYLQIFFFYFGCHVLGHKITSPFPTKQKYAKQPITIDESDQRFVKEGNR